VQATAQTRGQTFDSLFFFYRLALNILSANLSPAIERIVVMAFRGLNFWLPMLAGFFLLRKTKIFGPRQEA
jgi:hypothetical protein